MGDNVKRYMLR